MKLLQMPSTTIIYKKRVNKRVIYVYYVRPLIITRNPII
jgi:hypothetical protein